MPISSLCLYAPVAVARQMRPPQPHAKLHRSPSATTSFSLQSRIASVRSSVHFGPRAVSSIQYSISSARGSPSSSQFRKYEFVESSSSS